MYTFKYILFIKAAKHATSYIADSMSYKLLAILLIYFNYGGLYMKCKHCKHPIISAHNVCTRCGTPIHHSTHKGTWLWVIPIVFTFVMLGVFSPKTDSKASSLPDSPKVTPILYAQEKPMDTQEIILSSGSYVVGSDIQPGRYIMTTHSGTGSIYIYKGQYPYISELLTHPDNIDSTVAVTRIETCLNAGDRIQITDLSSVTCLLAPRFPKTTLSCGEHIVGIDVPPGDYTAITSKGTGHLMIYDATLSVRLSKVLTAHSLYDNDLQLKMSLTEGEIIKIGSLESVNLIP